MRPLTALLVYGTCSSPGAVPDPSGRRIVRLRASKSEQSCFPKTFGNKWWVSPYCGCFWSGLDKIDGGGSRVVTVPALKQKGFMFSVVALTTFTGLKLVFLSRAHASERFHL